MACSKVVAAEVKTSRSLTEVFCRWNRWFSVYWTWLQVEGGGGDGGEGSVEASMLLSWTVIIGGVLVS